MKKVYIHAGSAPFQFLHDYDAQESPLQPGTYIVPENSLEVAPPAFQPFKWPVAVNGAWVNAHDYRGTTYYMPDGSKHVITEIGIEPPALSTTEKPQIAIIDDIRAHMVVQSWAFKRALTLSGLRELVESYVAAADQDTKDMYTAVTFKRSSQFIVAAATALGKTPEEADALFTLAKSIEDAE